MMKLRLPWILLILSLALNLLFVGGFLWAKRVAPVPAWNIAARVERAAGSLKLDAAQRSALDHFAEAAHKGGGALREENRKLGDDAFALIGKPELDQPALDRLLDTISAHRRVFQGEISAALHEFLSKLSPEQREAVLGALRDRR